MENASKTGTSSPKENADQLKSSANELRRSAQSAAADQAANVKNSAANEMSGIASALRKASDELKDDSPQSRTFKQLSTGLADFSETIRDKSFSELSRDVSNFARRNPTVFLGASVLVGLMASRFAKASNSQSSSASSGSDRSEKHVLGTTSNPYAGVQPTNKRNAPGAVPLPGGSI